MRKNIVFSEVKEAVKSWDACRTNINVPASEVKASHSLLLKVNGNDHNMTDHAISQLCDKLRIPIGYYNRLPDDMAINQINYWKDHTNFRDKQLALKLHTDEIIGVHFSIILV